MWGRPASPRPTGLGMWLRGHRLCRDALDVLWKSVAVAWLQRRQLEAGRPAWLWLGSGSCCTDLLFSRPTLLHKLNWALILRVVTGFDFNLTWFRPFGSIL